MKTVIRSLIAFVLPLLLHAAGAEGDWNRVERLRPGQSIEVVDDKMRTLRGEFGAAGAEELSLQTASGPLIVKREAVMRVTVRKTRGGGGMRSSARRLVAGRTGVRHQRAAGGGAGCGAGGCVAWVRDRLQGRAYRRRQEVAHWRAET